MSQVMLVMGSDSDWPKVKEALETFKRFDVTCEVRVLSAHRSPDLLVQAIDRAEKGGTEIFIAAAGMAAHLAGVVAAMTCKPVIGIPIAGGAFQGQDALLSMVQMPPGIPVATVAVDGAKNAALLALQILSLKNEALQESLQEDRETMRNKVMEKDRKLQAELP
jgi:5-(carboxyamino)imidazole ribonucleotide mutase